MTVLRIATLPVVPLEYLQKFFDPDPFMRMIFFVPSNGQDWNLAVPNGGRLAVDGLEMTADRYSVNPATRALIAKGDVAALTTREDGSTVTMTAERKTIGESQ